jgi:hypothetical protein
MNRRAKPHIQKITRTFWKCWDRWFVHYTVGDVTHIDVPGYGVTPQQAFEAWRHGP